MLTTQTSQFGGRAERKAKQVRTVCRNTFRWQDGTDEVYRLHGTDIVRKRPDGRVTLNSGGWKTVTTKDRMNAYSGYHVFSDRGQWYVSKSFRWDESKVSAVPFYDGIVLPDAFNSAKLQAKAKKTETAEIKLRGDIKKFCNKLDKLDTLPEPSSGDCWLCMMHDAKTGKPVHNPDHLREHIKEGYLHGHLLLRALEFVGYPNPALIWHMDNRERQEKPRRRSNMVKRALRKYLFKQLGLAA